MSRQKRTTGGNDEGDKKQQMARVMRRSLESRRARHMEQAPKKGGGRKEQTYLARSWKA